MPEREHADGGGQHRGLQQLRRRAAADLAAGRAEELQQKPAVDGLTGFTTFLFGGHAFSLALVVVVPDLGKARQFAVTPSGRVLVVIGGLGRGHLGDDQNILDERR